MKIQPSFLFEKNVYLTENHQSVIIGVDEVGRGCLAGPVVAGAVEVPATFFSKTKELVPSWLEPVTDSKLIPENRRASIAADIQSHCVWGIGIASPEEIDEINILQASHLAMERAVIELLRKKAKVSSLLKNEQISLLIDGNIIPRAFRGKYFCKSIIKGDQKSYSIAAASIIAKVYRDQLMVNFETKYPGYAFGKHKGYSTALHQNALKKLGVTPIHRKSFAPVTALIK